MHHSLYTWFCNNGMALNPDKSEAINFKIVNITFNTALYISHNLHIYIPSYAFTLLLVP